MATRNYQEAYDALHSDNGLYAQCEMFLVTKAVPDILAEDPETPLHDDRIAWAREIEEDPAKRATAARRLVLKALQNGTVLAALGSGERPEDSDVEFIALTYLSDLIALGA